MGVVLDASALAKVFLNEEDAPALRAFVRETVEEGRELLAPRLIGYELGNVVLAQFPERDPEGRARVLEDALALVRAVPIEEPPEVFDVAGEPPSFSNACYLWLARREGAGLLTYDDRLREAARARDVEAVRPRTGPG